MLLFTPFPECLGHENHPYIDLEASEIMHVVASVCPSVCLCSQRLNRLNITPKTFCQIQQDTGSLGEIREINVHLFWRRVYITSRYAVIEPRAGILKDVLHRYWSHSIHV